MSREIDKQIAEMMGWTKIELAKVYLGGSDRAIGLVGTIP